MIFFVLSLVIQVLLIVHCIKTGRNTIWIWVLALLSYAGIIAYIAAELLPDLLGSRTARRAGAAAFQVTYQSRVGPTKWLGPDTVEFLEANAKDKVVVAVPIAFVSEHLETLYDLDHLAKDAAAKGGAAAFLRVPALGTRPDFVAALADVVRRGIAAQPAAA